MSLDPPPSLGPLSQWTRRKEMKMIENRHNKGDFSGVCPCQVTTYGRKSEFLRGR